METEAKIQYREICIKFISGSNVHKKNHTLTQQYLILSILYAVLDKKCTFLFNILLFLNIIL